MGHQNPGACRAAPPVVADLLMRPFRVPDWEQRLTRLVAAEMARPFAWGSADCATFAAAVVSELVGLDVLEGTRSWSSSAGALRSLKVIGCDTAEQFFARHLIEIPVAAAHRGDLVMPAGEAGPLVCPALLTGAEAMSRNEAGWVVMPRRLAARAYKVG